MSSQNSGCLCFNVTFEEEAVFDVAFCTCECFNIDFGEFVTIDKVYDIYNGSYTMDPATLDQILWTQDKVMEDNVTFHAVPYTEISNQAGGLTAIIG